MWIETLHHSSATLCIITFLTMFPTIYLPSIHALVESVFGITADKGTEVNQRQVINIHCFDIDGKLVTAQLAAHIINEIDISEDAAEESTAKALLAKVPRTTKKSCPKTLKRPQTTFLAPSFHMFVSVDSVEKITICSSITKCQKSASHPKDLSNAATAPRSFK